MLVFVIYSIEIEIETLLTKLTIKLQLIQKIVNYTNCQANYRKKNPFWQKTNKIT